MTKETLDFVTEKTNELLAAPMTCAPLRAEAEAWLAAKGTADEAAETKKYIAALEDGIQTLDNLIAFASSAEGVKYFGADTAKGIAAHAEELKAKGEKYCDCPACTAVAAILSKKAGLV